MIRRSLFIISLIIGCVLVSFSPMFDTATVTEDYDLTKHRLGFPFPIIEQHTGLSPMEDAFPFELGYVMPQENPTHLLILNYLLSIFIVTVITYIFLVIIGLLRKKFV